MKSQEELEILYKKFDRDVAKRSRLIRALIAFDQLCAVIFYNTSQDETISSHIHRRIENGKATWFDKKLCCLLKKLDSNHCYKARGE